MSISHIEEIFVKDMWKSADLLSFQIRIQPNPEGFITDQVMNHSDHRASLLVTDSSKVPADLVGGVDVVVGDSCRCRDLIGCVG